MADETQPQDPPVVSGVDSAAPVAEEAVAAEAQDVAPNDSSPIVEAEEEEEEEGEEEEVEEEEGKEEGDSGEENLALADELFEKGSKSIVDNDLADAVDFLGHSLEIRVKNYGELAQECATTYYKYGCALLYKAQEEADPLGSFSKNAPPKLAKSTSDIEGSGKSKASISGSSHDLPVKEEGSSSKDREDNSSGDNNCQDHSEGDGDDLAEVEEDESDLDLAWKMLDIARAIVEKHPGDSIDKVNIYSTLAEASMEREDMETSLNDYLKAISIAERLGEPNDRRVVELNFRICILLELDSKIEEAIPYCEKAIFLCKAHLERLKEQANAISTPTGTVEGCVADSQARVTELAREASSGSNLVKEIESLSGILSELEKKLEDLQQANESSTSVMTEVANLIGSKQRSGDLNLPGSISRDPSLNSSQMGTIVSAFDSPTIDSAATNVGVTHLGVVGRGTKRATIKPSIVEPSPKRIMIDSSVEISDSNITPQDSQGVDSSSLDAKSD